MKTTKTINEKIYDNVGTMTVIYRDDRLAVNISDEPNR